MRRRAEVVALLAVAVGVLLVSFDPAAVCLAGATGAAAAWHWGRP